MHNVFFSHFRIKENVKKVFDGDNFWNMRGVWEKSISLLMKIALSFMKFLTFFLPVFLQFLEFYYLAYWINDCELPDTVILWWLLATYVEFFTHFLGGVFYVYVLKECMKSFTIGWLRLNLILVLALVGLQAYVSYIKSRFSQSATKFEKIIHIDLRFIL